ncbi:MAG: hypothetical protein JSS83_21970 [Cyanobacteria bacterium SZAS LIN-3]|nr:hypothetical protein [Cyanobacteria bacterium SZAS LIN-3]
MKDPFLVLGLAKDTDNNKLNKAFKNLSARLAPSRFESDGKSAEQAATALNVCQQAYNAIIGGSSMPDREDSGEGLSARLRLGQLCLATHMISLEQLQEAVEAQAKSDKQLGEILQDLHFISQQELDGLLIGQDLIVGDEEVKDPQALRLLALNLITEELAVIGLLETRLTGESFITVLNRRNWLSKEITEAIFGDESDTAGSAS